jgi:5-methyltetrahydrofolate--homocysteine methyltransferase
MTTSILDEIKEAVIEGNAPAVLTGVQQALDEGLDPHTILDDALISAMSKVGELFEAQEFYIPEMLIAANAMQGGLGTLKPLLVQKGVEPIGKVALGTVQGDMHDVGKNLVSMMLEGAGFEVIDLGTDVPSEKFVAAAAEGVQIIGMSALLTTTMRSMRSTIEALVESGLRDRVKVVVGGAPVTQEFADKIGADGYAIDASAAATCAKRLVGE